MLDKLFVRVRSWLHSDPSAVLGEAASDNVEAKPNGKSSTTKKSRRNKQGLTPPPLPPDAWNEAESGMVITESGIIIIDPNAVEANRAAPPRPASMTVPADSAWALPSLSSPSPAPAAAASAKPESSASLNWDEVLARAKARISAVPDPAPSTPSKKTRAK
jgi:hypothetical protein